MKRAALYAYTLLVFGWLVCLQYDNTLGLNVLIPYLSTFRTEKTAAAKQDMRLVPVTAGGVMKIFCSNTGRMVFYTATSNDYTIPGKPVILYSYQNHVNDGTFCFNKY